MNFETAFEQNKTKKYIEGYHTFYNAILGNDTISSVLEIGVQNGASLFSWQKIWPEATIEGIDIVEPPYPIRKNFKVYALDSTNTAASELLNSKYDLIVDDGDQNWSCKLRTLLNYYNKANKYYVIENIMGVYSLNKIISKLPQLKLTEFFAFKSTGIRRTYSFRENEERIVEKDSHPIILFIKVSNLSKRFIHKNVFTESMLDIKEDKLKESIDIALDKASYYIKS